MTDMTTADESADDDDNAQHDNVGQDIDRHDNNGQTTNKLLKAE